MYLGENNIIWYWEELQSDTVGRNPKYILDLSVNPIGSCTLMNVVSVLLCLMIILMIISS